MIRRERHEYARALEYLRKALDIRELLKNKDPSNDQAPFEVAASQAEIGFVYAQRVFSARISSKEQSTLVREAAIWLKKALPAFQRRKERGKLKGSELATDDSIREQLDKCKRVLQHY